MYGRSLYGNREISSSITCSLGWSASGRRGAVADDARAGEVRPLYSSSAKPANKSEGSDAESVERREGAEGNTNKDRMRRTPSRVSMSSGLERVRERARAEKKKRFTPLLPHVDFDLP